jgi:hypothetical protein
MNTEPIKVDGNDKLHWLRRLDPVRSWEFLDEQRRCLHCGKTFSGHQVRLVGGTRPFGPLRLLCPTRRCTATSADWVYLHETREVVSQAPQSLPSARIVRIQRKRVGSSSSSRNGAIPQTQFAILRSGFRLLRYFGLGARPPAPFF